MLKNKTIALVILCCLFISIPSMAAIFTDYGSGTTVELAVGGGIWQVNWGQGPWTWFDPVGTSILDSTVTSIFDVHAIAPADITPELVATMFVEGTLTLTAHDPGDPDIVTGTMVLSGSGKNVIEMNAANVFSDEETGVFMAPFKPLEPKLTMNLQETTGIYEDIEQVGDWDFYWAGWYVAPLIEGMALQDNIFAVLGGQAPLVGGVAEFTLTGDSVPEPATLMLLSLGSVMFLRKRRV